MKSVVVGTAGHIDHGKSALVRALTGTDPDRLKEEKARGITIDLGFAHFMLDDLNVAFVDVPGHERFIKNMLAGVGGIDLVVLVVAADESVMPQTREHFDICRLLRVPAGLVAVTKTDLVDAETLELVQLEVRELVAASFLEGAPMVPVSSKTGQGLDEFRAALVATAARMRGHAAHGVARLPIDRVFSMKGFGTVVTGTLVSGRVRADDELVIAPGDRQVKVRGVQVHGARQPQAVAGQRSAVNIAGVEVEEIERGQNLVTAGAFQATRLADAVVEILPGARPLKHGARVRFHQGTAEILGRVSIIGQLPSAAGTPSSSAHGARAPSAPGGPLPGARGSRLPRARATSEDSPALPQRGSRLGGSGDARGPQAILAPGSRAFVRLRLERPAVLTRGDRYILRAYSPSVTIAGGHVLDPKPPATAIRTVAAVERCRRLDFDPAAETDRVASELRAVAVMIEDAGDAGLAISALVSRAAIDPGALDARIDALVAAAHAVRIEDVMVRPTVLDRLKTAIVAMLGEHHRDQPLSEGMPRGEARERSFGRGHPLVFERAVAELAAAGRIAARDRLALVSHRVSLSPEEERARAALERAFRDGGLRPPDAGSLLPAIGVAPAVADRMVKLLQRQKVLVKVDELLFHEEALRELKRDVTALKVSGGPNARIDVGTFKERFGITRKFAIPLLGYLDRERVTRRVGDARVLL